MYPNKINYHQAFSSDQHFIVASIAEGNEPSMSQCAIDSGKYFQRPSNRKNETAIAIRCPYPGISAEYFLWLANILNFTFEIRTPTQGSYGKRLDDGNWDGVVGMLSRGEADFSFHPIFMTSERASVIDYGPTVYERPMYGFLLKHPSGPKAMFSIFYPLNWSIYTAVAISFLLAFSTAIAIVFCKYGNRYRISKAIDIVWAMLDADADFLKRHFSLPVGLILFGWFIVVYAMINAYRSNLIVSAISETDQLPFRDLEDAARLIRSDRLRLVVPKENRLEFHNVLEALPSISDEYEPWAKLLNNYTPTVAADASEMAEYLSNSDYAYFGDIRSVTWMFVKSPPSKKIVNLDLAFVKTPQSAPGGSLGFRKDFPFKEEFNAAMMVMMTETVIKQMVKKYFPERYQKAGAAAELEDEESDGVKVKFLNRKIDALAFWQLLNLFSIWSIGCASAVFAFLVEIGCRAKCIAKD